MPFPLIALLAQVTTSVPATSVVLNTAGSEEGRGTIGGVVFFISFAIIVIGAVVLILRNRGRGTNARPPAAPSPGAGTGPSSGSGPA